MHSLFEGSRFWHRHRVGLFTITILILRPYNGWFSFWFSRTSHLPPFAWRTRNARCAAKVQWWWLYRDRERHVDNMRCWLWCRNAFRRWLIHWLSWIRKMCWIVIIIIIPP